MLQELVYAFLSHLIVKSIDKNPNSRPISYTTNTVSVV